MEKDIIGRVIGIVAELMDVSPETLSEETSFRKDLNMDSLDLYELVLELETVFDGRIKQEDVASIQTIQQAAEYIMAKLVRWLLGEGVAMARPLKKTVSRVVVSGRVEVKIGWVGGVFRPILPLVVPSLIVLKLG